MIYEQYKESARDNLETIERDLVSASWSLSGVIRGKKDTERVKSTEKLVSSAIFLPSTLINSKNNWKAEMFCIFGTEK